VATTVREVPGGLVLNGVKTWVTGAAYADLLIVYCRLHTGTAQDDDTGAGPSRGTDALLAVCADTPGVGIRPIPDPLGCRAGGHADLDLADVRLPASALLGTARMPGALVTSALTYGRLSVAWGCVGILRSCLAQAAAHARSRRQFGRRIADFQLVAAHLADLLVAEQAATRVCEHASGRWDGDAPDVVAEAVLAKHLAAESAAAGARRAVQVLASAGARDSHPVARAYRDAKLMEIIEGTGEVSRLLLAEQALARWSRPRRPEGAQ
jgi:alkylation response protein AidB-like acyl-CoA dehydrogenase